MKKLISIIISFLLVLVVLAGCSGGRTVKNGYISVFVPDGWEYRSDTYGYAPSEGHFFAEVKDEKGNYVWYAMHPYSGEHTPQEQLEIAMENSGAEIVSWLDNITVSDMEFTAVECELNGKRNASATCAIWRRNSFLRANILTAGFSARARPCTALFSVRSRKLLKARPAVI